MHGIIALPEINIPFVIFEISPMTPSRTQNPILVMKFGGTSLDGPARIRAVTEIIGVALDEGFQPVIAASAMGKTTDALLALARELEADVAGRDLDLLLSTGEVVSCALLSGALNARGLPARAFTGPAAGIVTDRRHGRARIQHIAPARLRQVLTDGIIPIVAGFQGATDDGSVTTLGRGASDTTAVALATALDADHCRIYTDVDGIYSADPRVVPKARRIGRISYEEILEMAILGASVMHPRSIEVAGRNRVTIEVRSSFNSNPGTWIMHSDQIDIETGTGVRAVVTDADVAQITVVGVPDRPGLAHSVLAPLAQAGISVDLIVQNISHHGLTDISFSVQRSDAHEAIRTTRVVAKEIGASSVSTETDVGKISVVGTGMVSRPGVAAAMFGALADAKINIHSITTSEIRVTCLIGEQHLAEGARVLHSAFGLDE